MKRFPLLIVSVVLAVALLFGSLMGQTNTAHAATTASRTQSNLTTTIQHLEFALTVLKPHLHLSAQGMLSLDISSGTSVGLDSKTFSLFAKAVPGYNYGFSKYRSMAHKASSIHQAGVHPFFSSWWDAYTQCLSWPVNQIAREASGMVAAAGGIIAFWYFVAGVTLPGWVAWFGLVAAILFIGTAAFCAGFATGYLIWG
ncbi:MAG: hypothetical protein ACYDER_10495 [Ktedonobacteraceae bacterium]